MIKKEDIRKLIGEHIPPYLYGKNKTDRVFYSGPYWNQEELIEAVHTFLNGSWITSGAKVLKFEQDFSKKFNVKFSRMVNSGSSANLILMAGLKRRFNWSDGDEIIVSPVGFPTTISVIEQNHLKPVFVDIDWRTLNFDVNKIEDKISDKTKAIFISPVLGNPPYMDILIDYRNRYGLRLVGDNCDSLGSRWGKSLLSEYYDAYSNSFYPSHHITTGEGGMVCTNDEELADIFLSLINWGRDCYCRGSANLLQNGTCGCRFSSWLDQYDGIIDHKYIFTHMGYNLKPLDLQGAIGSVQLKKFDEIEEKRINSYNIISKLFKKYIPNIEVISKYKAAHVSWFGVPLVVKNREEKQKLVQFLEDNNIQTRNYFAGNILMHPGYQHLGDYRIYPEANKVLDTVFFVGSAPHYTEETFNYIELVLSKYV